MSTTLTNGLKLPDKGSVDWYADMQNNYAILDGAVGTVAEHTTALAGKAPAVHTHTKSDITDFPALANVATSGSYNDLNNIPASFTPASHSHGNLTNDGKVGTTANLPLITGTGGVVQTGSFGNAANTFCEGNDSRLSDARTPVAHTHTKADVTDLLNSNFIPSANNSYNLGSSSYQWNNLYAKGYYYNGVAWGLDKANVWTSSNQFNASVKFSGQIGINWARGGSVGTLPSSVLYYGFQNALDSNDNVFDRIRSYVSTTGTNLQEHIKYAWNDLTKYATINYWINADGSDSEYKLSVKRVIPGVSNTTDLGTSTNKWKSFNGVNPGDLSLPDYNSNAKLNLTSTFPTPDANGNISYTPTMNGWLYVYFDVSSATINSGSVLIATIKDANMANANCAQMFWRLPPASDLLVFFPVVANKQFIIQINFTGYTLKKALLIPGMGYVA